MTYKQDDKVKWIFLFICVVSDIFQSQLSEMFGFWINFSVLLLNSQNFQFMIVFAKPFRNDFNFVSIRIEFFKMMCIRN